MTSEEILEEICGRENVVIFKRVKRVSMRVAEAARRVAARELRGSIPEKGKQFLYTSEGAFRLCSGYNSDNTTETRAHSEMGAMTVQMFGRISRKRRDHGVLDMQDLYHLHRAKYDEDRFLALLSDELS